MPTYEYRCDACKRQMEIEQRITEDRLTKCPKCGKKKLVRLVGTGNFILKGSGWGKDLYSSAPPKSSKSDDSSGESKSDNAKSESKSDSAKSESKSDSGKSESGKSDASTSDAKKSKADKPAKK